MTDLTPALKELVAEIVAQRDTSNRALELIQNLFTREDVWLLRNLANQVYEDEVVITQDDELRNLADRLEALLPPDAT